MIKEKITNRYGDEFTFTQDKDGNVLWEGNFEYFRTSLNGDGDIIMVDPSGGPCLTSGMNLAIMETYICRPEIHDKEISTFQEMEIDGLLYGFKIILR